MKKILLVVLTVLLILTGCGINEDILSSNDPNVKKWGLIEDSAKSSVVRVAMDTDNQALKDWMKNEFASTLKLNNNIVLEVVDQSLTKTHEQLAEAIRTESEVGYFDLVFFEDIGFKSFNADKMLYGPFVDDLPNYKEYINPNSFEWQFREGVGTQSAFVPVGRNQLALIYNRDVIYEPPTDFQQLWEYAKEFKGAITYPDPRSSKEGKAFLISVLLADQDIEKWMSSSFDRALFKSVIAPQLQDLVDVKPYLFEKGEAYPETIESMDDLFFNEAILLSMSFDYDHAMVKLMDYSYPEGAATFVVDSGTMGHTQGFSILYNAPNKSGALVVLNTLLSPDIQVEKYNPKGLGQLPIYDPNYVDSSVTDGFKTIKLKPTAIKQDVLLAKRVEELPSEVIEYAVELWTDAIFSTQTDTDKP